jgi:phage-related protein
MKKKNDTSATERKADLIVEYSPEKAVKKELNNLAVRDSFLASLTLLAKHLPPACETDELFTIDKGVHELIIKGSPGYRCVYTIEVPGKIIVLHACKKTTNGVDRQIKSTVELRLKALRAELMAAAKAAKRAKKKKK